MISNKRIATVMVLFALAYFTMQHFDDIKSTPILQPLEKIPEKIDGWRVVQKRHLLDAVVDKLGVDDYIDYTYENNQGKRIDLYVSYFSAVGIRGTYHSPQNCLPGQGWNILSVEEVPIKYNGSQNVAINKMTVTKGNRKQLVYYWFQNRGRIIASEYWDKIYTVLDSIMLRRRDGSFIRVMSNDNDPQASKAFSQKIALLLKNYLPGK